MPLAVVASVLLRWEASGPCQGAAGVPSWPSLPSLHGLYRAVAMER